MTGGIRTNKTRVREHQTSRKNQDLDNAIPVVTEISPIFGLSLLGLIDVAVIVGAFVGIGASLIIARAIRIGEAKMFR